MAQLTKRFRRILTATLLILLVAGAAYTLGWSKALVIKEISYSGVSAGSPEGMLIKNSLEGAQSERALNKPLARLNIAALANKLNNILEVNFFFFHQQGFFFTNVIINCFDKVT